MYLGGIQTMSELPCATLPIHLNERCHIFSPYNNSTQKIEACKCWPAYIVIKMDEPVSIVSSVWMEDLLSLLSLEWYWISPLSIWCYVFNFIAAVCTKNIYEILYPGQKKTTSQAGLSYFQWIIGCHVVASCSRHPFEFLNIIHNFSAAVICAICCFLRWNLYLLEILCRAF